MFPDKTFYIMDGFDSAIIGIDMRKMLLMYSVKRIIEKLCEQMSLSDSWEYYLYNIESPAQYKVILIDDHYDLFSF
jgi:hypothetical protein